MRIGDVNASWWRGLGSAALVALAVAFQAPAPVAAQDADDAPAPAKADVLTEKGLKLVGTTYVLGDEEGVKKKAADVRKLARELRSLELKQAACVTPEAYQAYLQNLNGQINELKGEQQMARQQANQASRWGGRMARYYGQAQRNQANSYVNELNQEINQINQVLAQARKNPPDPKLKQKADSDVLAARTEHDQAVEELSRLVHATKDRYGELAKDKAVSRAIKAAQATVKPSPRLGPSHEFQEIAKQLDKLEKDHARSNARTRSHGHSSRGSGLDFQ